MNKIVELSISKEAIKRQKDLKIVFTPIHGTGITVVPKVLELFGFENVTIVEEQSNPDGNFPTVVYPNPEEAEALSIAIKKAQEIDADLVLATDPDADRVGIAIKNDKNEFQLLNGNQTGALLIYYLVNAWKEANKITGKQYVVKTIVTTGLIAKIAEKNGAGEILLTSMDKDGTKTGYDLELTKAISSLVSIPVIASGGVGNLDHLYEGFNIGLASAVLAASIFHYGEYSIMDAKNYLIKKGIPIRI